MEKHEPAFRNTQDFIEKILFGVLKWKIHPKKLVVCTEDERIIKEPDLEIEFQYDLIPKKDRSNIRLEAVQKLMYRMTHKIKEEHWNQLRNDMHDPLLLHESSQELENLARIIVRDEDEDKYQKGTEHARNKLKYILLNFYKQIKHKVINEEDLDYPVVPIFYGAQGLAKSKLVKFLSDYFNPFVKKMNVQQVTDFDRFYKFLRDRMVIRIDELDGADKAPLAVLKSLVTDLEITAKRYHSQNPIEDYCFATFIITSNKRSFKVFRDSSGNRRWADFEIFHEIDFEELKKINLVTLIKGIPLSDTEEEKMRMRVMSEKYLIPDQLEYKHHDDVDEFVEEMQIFINLEERGKNKFISKTDLFKDFQAFRKKRGRSSNNLLTLNYFWASIKDILRTVEFDEKTMKKFIDTNRLQNKNRVRGVLIDLESYKKKKDEVLGDSGVSFFDI